METESFNKTRAQIAISSDELLIINNALNEVCNGIDLRGEFDTRMGCNLQEATRLLEAVHALVSEMKHADS
jgi:hypothetical protein